MRPGPITRMFMAQHTGRSIFVDAKRCQTDFSNAGLLRIDVELRAPTQPLFLVYHNEPRKVPRIRAAVTAIEAFVRRHGGRLNIRSAFGAREDKAPVAGATSGSYAAVAIGRMLPCRRAGIEQARCFSEDCVLRHQKARICAATKHCH